MPMSTRLSTTMVHTTQMPKPMCSLNMDRARFFLAIAFPVSSQEDSSSGLHVSIQWLR